MIEKNLTRYLMRLWKLFSTNCLSVYIWLKLEYLLKIKLPFFQYFLLNIKHLSNTLVKSIERLYE